MKNQDYDYLGYECLKCIHCIMPDSICSEKMIRHCKITKVTKIVYKGQFQLPCPLKEIQG